jgi:N-glycosylase/DNA lyase
MPSLKRKANSSVTDALYGEISNFFKDQFGADCGWAHSLLFAAELTMFKLPSANKATKRESPSEEGDVESKIAVKVKRETTTLTVETTTRRRSSRLSGGKREAEVERKEKESEETPITSRRKKRRASAE